MTRPARLFKGSEFPRLLLLACIMVAGWAIVMRYVWTKQAAPPPPRPMVAADIPPPIPPDDGLAFVRLQDREPVSSLDDAAYVTLLERARETPPAELAAKARREILMTHLFSNPKQYRGVPIHLEGTALKVLTHDVSERMSPTKRLFEAWVITRDSMNRPYCLVFEDPPKNLPIAVVVNEQVVFDGYFLKWFKYLPPHDKPSRVAPILIGRLRRIAPAPGSPGGAVSKDDWLNWALPVLVVLMVISLGRWIFRLRGSFAPRRPATAFIRPNDEIDPDSLAEWLQKEGDEPEPDEGDSGGGPGDSPPHHGPTNGHPHAASAPSVWSRPPESS